MTDTNYIRRQLLLDFEHFARRMRLKDTMDFVNFIGKTKVSQDTILVSMDATSLYTNIPQEEGVTKYAKHTRHSTAINFLYRHTTSKKYFNLFFRKIHSNLLETIIFRPTEMQYQWYKNGRCVCKHMADVETKVINQSKTKPIEWKRFIDDIFSLWDSDKKEIKLFIEQANNFHPTIKFTAEISENETEAIIITVQRVSFL